MATILNAETVVNEMRAIPQKQKKGQPSVGGLRSPTHQLEDGEIKAITYGKG